MASLANPVLGGICVECCGLLLPGQQHTLTPQYSTPPPVLLLAKAHNTTHNPRQVLPTEVVRHGLLGEPRAGGSICLCCGLLLPGLELMLRY